MNTFKISLIALAISATAATAAFADGNRVVGFPGEEPIINQPGATATTDQFTTSAANLFGGNAQQTIVQKDHVH